MKTIISILIVLVTNSANGQSKKLLHEYKQKPITDTVYLYIEKKFNDSDGGVTIWQQDLQTGYRYESRCTCPKDSLPKIGTVARTLRSKLILEPKNKKRD